MSDPNSIPMARVEARRGTRLNWLLPIAALLAALFWATEQWLSDGPSITIYAGEGHGMGVGDPLRYRGVDVGRVQRIRLTPELDRVALEVDLEPQAAKLCREGSSFWIVRPQMAVDSVRGLETIVGTRYLSVQPGDLNGSAKFEFQALSDPPSSEHLEEEGLELRLQASTRSNLSSGAQITYRGVVIGSVLRTRLASDAGSVEIDAYVRPEYRDLVRANSWFWNTGGLEVSLALAGGLSIELDSLRSLVVGGISLATPTEAGKVVEDGWSFVLNDQAHEDAKEWRPLLAAAPPLELGESPWLHQSPVRLTFESGRVLKRDEEISGWGLRVPRGVLAPEDLLELPEELEDPEAALDFDESELDLDAALLWRGSGLALRAVPDSSSTGLRADRVRFAPALQDCQAFMPDSPTPLILSRTRLQATPEGWRIEAELALSRDWHGALVYGVESQAYVGLLLVEEDQGRIVPFMAEAW